MVAKSISRHEMKPWKELQFGIYRGLESFQGLNRVQDLVHPQYDPSSSPASSSDLDGQQFKCMVGPFGGHQHSVGIIYAHQPLVSFQMIMHGHVGTACRCWQLTLLSPTFRVSLAACLGLDPKCSSCSQPVVRGALASLSVWFVPY